MTSTDERRIAAPNPAGGQARSGPAAAEARAAGEVELLPIRGVAQRLADRMNESLAVPTATSFREVDVAVLQARRAALNRAIAPRKLSFTHLIAYAVAQAVAVHPEMATFYREVEGRPHRGVPRRIGLGLAVDVEQRDNSRMLMVPVIAAADDLSFLDFVAAYDVLVERARNGRLRPDDLAGATITLTNPGTVGTTASMPRLMAGQGTIVATGAIHRAGERPVMIVSSTYDHRIIQGAESGIFLRTIDELLQGGEEFYEYVAESYGLSSSIWETPGPQAADRSATPAASAETGGTSAEEASAAMALVHSLRTLGHRAARLDPLGAEPPGDPALDPANWGLTEQSMARVPASALQVDVPGRTLAEVLPELRRVYTGTMAFELEHIASHDERAWLREAVESGEYAGQPAPELRRKVLGQLTEVEALEHLLARAYLGQTRFSIEGLDVLVPMLDLLVDLAAAAGTRTVEIGMPHRGRLDVLAHVVGLPAAEILAQFATPAAGSQDEPAPEGDTSDVRYHIGAEGRRDTPAGAIRISLSPNPSHLEAIDPVVEGRARAEQTDRSGPETARDPDVALPLLIHGDAAFAAQGVVAETFNLARLAGYTTGGTIHLIANNQLGFTVEPSEGRSTDYASDLAKGFDVPIVHVNADDPDACLSAVRLALAYRGRFHGDFVIDVIGYRRYGHNEGDEPAYTQPLMAARIAEHPPVRELYLRRLVAEGVVDEASPQAELKAAEARLAEVRERLAAGPPTSGGEPGAAGDALAADSAKPAASARRLRSGRASAKAKPPATAVSAAQLKAIEEALVAVPSGFTVHPKLVPQLDRRRESIAGGKGINWGQAEALAFGSLLLDGVPIRLTGQDAVRGTFSQRHLEFHDAANGNRYAPMQHLPGARAPIELHDSPLSEYACLGFEYGYSVASQALVLWEAQYGDFANGAEIVIDQFVISGLAKWGQTSRLVMLLPHGYEGQGPDHSSGRLERFLALGAESNIRVANCSTPAQYFHLLRDQALRDVPRPLVLMTPKGLLRLPAASSSLADLTGGRFEPVLDDPEHASARDRVRRLVLASGRIYYELIQSPRWREPDVAVARVELLYPFPREELSALLSRYPHLEKVVWAQEEPWNMGARKFVMPEIASLLAQGVTLDAVARPERSSPAEGYLGAHRAEQQRIVREAMGG